MATITAIKPQKNKKRVNIYLDGKFAFGLDLESFMKQGLKVEQELLDKEISQILKKAEFQKVSDKLLKFAALRPRSEREINDWLRKYKIHKSLYKELFNKLNRLELIDDKKFAGWWVEQRLHFKFKSKRELIFELRKKGIDKSTIENVLSEVHINEEKMAMELLKKRRYKWKKLSKFEARRKMGEFLGRKGFNWDTIKQVIDRFVEKK